MQNKITDLILDFDGTCTQIPLIYKHYLQDYLIQLNLALPPNQQLLPDEWENAKKQVIAHSPAAGWTAKTTPSAPAAADPYILSSEAARYAFRNHKPAIALDPPQSAFGNAAGANPAPWRVETLEVIKTLVEKGVSIHFVSNSSKQTITQRFQDLWGGTPTPTTVNVFGGATKFQIGEPDWDTLTGIPAQLIDKWNNVPAVKHGVDIGRPIYQRRSAFFSVIAGIFKDHPERLTTALFCGDVWELDLALPAAMGTSIHLIERAEPFHTYDYERQLTLKAQGKISDDLTGLLQWIK